ncbi:MULTISPECIES: sulfotransferase family 2 domain-containing protein [Rossellomorea]|uniref:sulfotransferase family 2 domain-containing protein n=1 Tax=Rossellomorea TaxID=2837508 RepID=UPI001CC9725A|nr:MULTISPECIES: sulfotransferase family 2 domain-containing protein [Rossellomorea]MCA0148545.1 sulfotransferase family protein [Rossellomorea vietnamensis]WGG47598.1 sulfotransferase family 2 domain-containing protein [Rossellomorea sp. DA94]
MIMHRRQLIENLMNYYKTPLYHQNFPLMLMWTPKAGCTTFARWFFYQTGLLDTALEYHPSIHVYKNAVYFKQKRYMEAVLNDGLNKKVVYKLVRNPYKRAVSSYFTIATYCYSSGSPDSPMDKDKERISAMFYPNTTYKGISFKQFLIYLSIVGADYTNVDGHIAKQYCLGEECLSPKLIKLENFNTEIKEIESGYNLLSSSDKILTSPHSFSPQMTETEVNSDTILSYTQLIHGPLPKYKSLYDKETIALCQHVFHDDFQYYQYGKEIL